jgi:hypothetical protein
MPNLITPVFRVSFPKLFEPESYNGGAAKYSVAAIWDPSKFTAAEKKQWQEDWDDEEVDEDFAKQLRA